MISSVEVREAQMIMLNILEEVHRICEKNKIEYWLDSGTLLGAVRHKGFIPWDDDLDIGMERSEYYRFIEACKKDLDNTRYFAQTMETDSETQIQYLKIRDRNSILQINEREKGHTGIFVDVFPMDSYDAKDSSDSNFKLKRKMNFKILFYWMKNAEIKKPFLKNIKGNIVKIVSKTYYSLARKYDYKNLNKEAQQIIDKVKINSNKTSKYIGYGVEVPFNQILRTDIIFPLGKLEFEGKEYSVPGKWDEYLKEFYGNYMELPKPEDRVPSHCLVLKTKLTKEEYEKLNKNY